MASPGSRRQQPSVENYGADEEGFHTDSEASADDDDTSNNVREDLLSSDPLAESLEEP